MSKELIKSFPDFIKEKTDENDLLVSELFADTLQGENMVGYPATFLRLQNCSLNCVWCDTKEVWRMGNPYTFKEIFDLFESINLIERFKDGQRLVITGGSPLLQQENVAKFLIQFIEKYGFKPLIEIENECAIMPSEQMIAMVNIWNNSPKLSNSFNVGELRYQPEILRKMSSLENSWFKFVIMNGSDWDEIEEKYLKPGLIRKNQIVLMPQGQTQVELKATRLYAASLAIKHNIRFTDRLHITLWDKKTGV